MNIAKFTNRMMGKRHKPRSCHSRWRKTLQKRFKLGKIVDATPGNPLMTVQYYEPKTEEARQAIEQENLKVMMSAMPLGPMAFLNPSKFMELLEAGRE